MDKQNKTAKKKEYKKLYMRKWRAKNKVKYNKYQRELQQKQRDRLKELEAKERKNK